MNEATGIRIHVGEGEIRIDHDADVCLTTVLGSCVAACIYDPAARTGGMNHFLLAGDACSRSGAAERYGVYQMEVLVNGLMERGARRDTLRAKLFGGARTGAGGSAIGAANAAFAKRFLALENIALTGCSLGGEGARRVEFWPATGRARQMFIKDAPPPPPPAPILGDLGDVEFF